MCISRRGSHVLFRKEYARRFQAYHLRYHDADIFSLNKLIGFRHTEAAISSNHPKTF